jgi:tetrapyrrole methylase family protein/MazG family protein
MGAAEITVVGLGTGDENQLSLGIYKKLQNSKHVYVRTKLHPVVRFLEQNQLHFQSFDKVYEKQESFSKVYEIISELLIAEARRLPAEEEMIYAVPGHPMVAEYTVQLLRRRCPEEGIGLHILGGESFLDQAFLRLGFDPIEGFQLLDGTDLHRSALNPGIHTVIGQIYDSHIASDVKLTLMEVYPDDYPVVIAHALGIQGDERIRKVPLFELDRKEDFGNLSLVWIPKTEQESITRRTFERLHEIIAVLRSPEGCPWDREQTHASIRKNLIEETYEVLETIDDDDPDAMREELGDLLLQVMLHSQMEEEAGTFTVYDVIGELNDKLIFRHPHVFGDKGADNADEALENWQAMKAKEKEKKGIDTAALSVLAGVPRDLPALLKAVKLQKKAAEVGFDWDRIDDVMLKIEEELAELKEAIEEGSLDKHQEELGDLLFAVVNLARFLKTDPEMALAATNKKFIRRFEYIEEQLRISGKNFVQTDLTEMEKWWQQAKDLPKA